MDKQRLAQWLDERGVVAAGALEAKVGPICAEVSDRVAQAFPDLCLDPARPDAPAFQQLVIQQSPRRFHRLIQSVLIFQTLTVVTQEYTWLWGRLPRYGVTSAHMLGVAGWYFSAAQRQLSLPEADKAALAALKDAVLTQIRAVVVVAEPCDEL